MKLPYDWVVYKAITQAPADPEAAAKVLLLAAERLRAGEPLDRDLTRYLADAFEAAMAQPPRSRAAELARKLHLTAGHRRPVKADWYEVGQRFDQLRAEGRSKSSAATDCAVEFAISESSAKRHWEKYLKAVEEHDRIDAEERDGEDHRA